MPGVTGWWLVGGVVGIWQGGGPGVQGERVQWEVRVEGGRQSIKKYWFKFIDTAGCSQRTFRGLAHFSAILTPLSMRRPPQVPCPLPPVPKFIDEQKTRRERASMTIGSVCILKTE